MGAVLKDPRTGLVDFYGQVDGKRVWLCWKYGEDAVTHYHGLRRGLLRAQAHRAGHAPAGTSTERRQHAIDREAAARAIDAFLRALGRDPEREPELAGTGERVARAWADELLAGYARRRRTRCSRETRLRRHARTSSSCATSRSRRCARTTCCPRPA